MSRIILLNKPFNVLSQFRDDQGRATLKDYLPNHPGFYPAGRLDYDSEGLMLLTDNGELQHQISHPSQKQPKTYWAQVEGAPSIDDLKPLIKGVTLKDGPCKPAQVRILPPPTIWPRKPPIRERKEIPDTWLEIIITEGRNRQVRRMTAAIGFPTLRLVRAKIGNWSVEGLQPGEFTIETVHSVKQKSAAKPNRYSKKTPPTRRHTPRRAR